MGNWLYAAEDEVKAMVIAQDTDAATLASRLWRIPAVGIQDVRNKFWLAMQLESDSEITEAVRELGRFPEHVSDEVLGSIEYYCKHWQTRKLLLEQCAPHHACLAPRNLFYDWKAAGGSVQEIDRWILTIKGGDGGDWLAERLKFLYGEGKGNDILAELAADAQAHPLEIEKCIRYLQTVLSIRNCLKRLPRLSWVVKSVNPLRTIQNAQIAKLFSGLELLEEAVLFYRRAIEIPLTDEDDRSQYYVPEEMASDKWPHRYMAELLHELAFCLARIDGREEESWPYLRREAEIRRTNHLWINDHIVGSMQLISGEPDSELRYREEMEVKANDPEFWLRWEDYNNGRKMPELQEDAVKRAFRLSTPQLEKGDYASDDYSDPRMKSLSWYADVLKWQERPEEAAALLRKEVEEAPADSYSAIWAAEQLGDEEWQDYIACEDEVLWSWLGQRRIWGQPEIHLLCALTGVTYDEGRADHPHLVDRAEQMVCGFSESRRLVAGILLAWGGFYERAIPYLEIAARQSQGITLEDACQGALLKAYAKTGKWRQAELFLPSIKTLSNYAIVQYYINVANTAAEFGAEQDAERIWWSIARQMPWELSSLCELKHPGLREKAARFYRRLEGLLPCTTFPKRALDLLCER